MACEPGAAAEPRDEQHMKGAENMQCVRAAGNLQCKVTELTKTDCTHQLLANIIVIKWVRNIVLGFETEINDTTTRSDFLNLDCPFLVTHLDSQQFDVIQPHVLSPYQLMHMLLCTSPIA